MPFLTDIATKIKTWANAKFQPMLVSGTNLRTINGNTLLGSTNIVIGGETVNIETLSANKTLTASDAPIQIYTCAANRDVNLPTTGLVTGQKFEIKNNNTSATERITVKQSTTTIAIIGKKTSKIFRWNGTGWYVATDFVSDNNTGIGVNIGAGTYNNAGIAIGDNIVTATGIAIGSSAYCWNQAVAAIGNNAMANAKNAVVFKRGAHTRNQNEFALSGSEDTNYNRTRYVTVTSREFDLALNTWQEMLIDSSGGSGRLGFNGDILCTFKLVISAYCITGGVRSGKAWEIVGCINGYNNSFIGTPVTTLIGADTGMTGIDVRVSMDNYNLKIECIKNTAERVRFAYVFTGLEITTQSIGS